MGVCEAGEEGEGYPWLGADEPAFYEGSRGASTGGAVVEENHGHSGGYLVLGADFLEAGGGGGDEGAGGECGDGDGVADCGAETTAAEFEGIFW